MDEEPKSILNIFLEIVSQLWNVPYLYICRFFIGAPKQVNEQETNEKQQAIYPA
jgi:hypothetical protein